MDKPTTIGELTLQASIDKKDLEVFASELNDAANLINQAINLLNNAEQNEIKVPIHLTRQ